MSASLEMTFSKASQDVRVLIVAFLAPEMDPHAPRGKGPFSTLVAPSASAQRLMGNCQRFEDPTGSQSARRRGRGSARGGRARVHPCPTWEQARARAQAYACRPAGGLRH
eukprot:1149092-Pelagomonas_calceolata.AAC.1